MASNLVAQQLLIVVVIFHIQHVHWLFYWKTWQILAVTFIYSPCSRTFLQKPAAVLQTQHHPGLQQTFCSYTEGKCSVCTYCTVLLWLRSSNKAPSQGSFWTRFQLLTRAAQIPSVRVCFVKIACWTQNHIKEHLSSQFTQFGFMFTAVFMKKDVLWVTVTVCTHKEDTSAYFEKNGKKNHLSSAFRKPDKPVVEGQDWDFTAAGVCPLSLVPVTWKKKQAKGSNHIWHLFYFLVTIAVLVKQTTNISS